MIPKLKNILKRKFRKGFIKYLKSLDYDEYKYLFASYMKIIIRYEKRYIKTNPKKFRKDWFINKKIKSIYYKLHRIFFFSNPEYLGEISSEMNESNKHKENVLDDFSKTKKAVESLTKQVLTFSEPPTKNDIIKISAMMIDSIYLSTKLQNLSDEIDNFKMF